MKFGCFYYLASKTSQIYFPNNFLNLDFPPIFASYYKYSLTILHLSNTYIAPQLIIVGWSGFISLQLAIQSDQVITRKPNQCYNFRQFPYFWIVFCNSIVDSPLEIQGLFCDEYWYSVLCTRSTCLFSNPSSYSRARNVLNRHLFTATISVNFRIFGSFFEILLWTSH